MKISKTMIASIIAGLLAVLGLVGPYVLGSIFELSTKCDGVWGKILVAVLFIAVNVVNLKFGDKKEWRWVTMIAAIIVVVFLTNTVMVGWITAWKNYTAVRIGSIVVLVASAIVDFVEVLRQRGEAVQ